MMQFLISNPDYTKMKQPNGFTVCLYLFIIHLIIISVESVNEDFLRDIQTKLFDNDFVKAGSTGNALLSYAFNNYKNNSFVEYIGQEPILIVALFDKSAGSFGNNLGFFFEALSCADILGLHFLSVPLAKTSQSVLDPFYDALPLLKVHPSPSNRSATVDVIDSKCSDTFPWQSRDRAWIQRVEMLGDIVAAGVDKHIQNAYPTSPQMIKLETFDASNKIDAVPDFQLPFIPDVSILFRCSDIMTHKSTESPYGFLNFNAYSLMIPAGAQYIYILSEPLTYGGHGDACHSVSKGLIDFLSALYPQAFIGIRRGQHFDGLAMLTKSAVSICTASTFCLWPGIANKNTVYYSLTWLVCTGRPMYLTEHFNWMSYPKLSHFGLFDLDSPQLADEVLAALKAPIPSI